jgi:long-chain acyl-CoA synthetase
MFNNSVKHYGNRNCFGTRFPLATDPKTGITTWSGYQWKSYNDVHKDRVLFGAGLMTVYDLYIQNKTPSWYLGIYSVNRYEWVVADLGAGCYSVPTVSLYDTLGPETSEYIINHSELPIIATSVDKVANLLALAPKCPTLKVIIVMESLFKYQESAIPILQKWGAQVGITVLPFSEILYVYQLKRSIHFFLDAF